MIRAPIRLRGCAGWSAPLLFAIKKSQGFSCLCPYDVEAQATLLPPCCTPAISKVLFAEVEKSTGREEPPEDSDIEQNTEMPVIDLAHTSYESDSQMSLTSESLKSNVRVMIFTLQFCSRRHFQILLCLGYLPASSDFCYLLISFAYS